MESGISASRTGIMTKCSPNECVPTMSALLFSAGRAFCQASCARAAVAVEHDPSRMGLLVRSTARASSVWAATARESHDVHCRSSLSRGFLAMTTPGGPTNYSSMTDAELRALEKDGTLPPAAWQEVIDELGRRRATAPRPGAPASPPPAAAARSRPRPGPTDADAADDDDSRLAQAVQHLNALLVPGETLVAYAVQRRLFALLHRRDARRRNERAPDSHQSRHLRRILTHRHAVAGYRECAAARRHLRRGSDDHIARPAGSRIERTGRRCDHHARASKGSRPSRCIGRRRHRSSRGARSAACATSTSCARNPAAFSSAAAAQPLSGRRRRRRCG